MAPSRSTSEPSQRQGTRRRPGFRRHRLPRHRRWRPVRGGLPTPLNGRKTNPPSPRDQRAIQYFAYPNWKFDRLREQYPDGGLRSGRGHRPRRMDHAQARHRRRPAGRDCQRNRNPGIERNQGGTRRRSRRPVRQHRQRILLLQPQDHAALSACGGLPGERDASVLSYPGSSRTAWCRAPPSLCRPASWPRRLQAPSV
jgi:hypothetical protein